MEQPPPPAELTAREAAAELRVHRNTVQRMLRDRDLPGAWRLPTGAWRIPRTAIDALREATRGPAAPDDALAAALTEWVHEHTDCTDLNEQDLAEFLRGWGR